MTAILDPFHSRPIDVHRWSQHPEVGAWVDQLWDEVFKDMQGPRPGPKPKTPFRTQLKILILDIYVAWLEDTELSIGVSMNANAYDTRSRYNALGISKHIIQVIKRLVEAEYLVIAKGSYSGAGAGGNRVTRVRASDRLRALFDRSAVTRDDITRVRTQECVILRGSQDKLVDYEDTDETNRQRGELRAYNLVLANHFIDVSTLEQPQLVTGQDHGRDVIQQISHHHHFIRRVYSRGDWGCNGRFYGGWWQQISSDYRKDILIDDTPTVEVDFKGLHLQLLAAEQGADLPDDPYLLPEGTIPRAPPSLQRTLLKKLVLTALNAADRPSAYRSFRSEWPTGHMGKTLTNEDLKALTDKLLERYHFLRDLVFADQGIRLMNVDSQIAERVHRHFAKQEVVVLSVHDSFIVDYTRVGELRWVLAEASEAVVGRPLPIDRVGVGLDEIDADKREDLKQWRDARVVRCEGYLARKAAWEERVGRTVSPLP
ncbi:hypothetical protein GV827_16805 [Sulfitobacter sp. JBTF-M27]|uniref:DNA-directed DNA polymerase family A palm domain-containing protein n=1 Tax=Sulfitobacter sediminilitoris TaxID=2698830 RepID=A0A6P0CD23_9RHOB|nr:hypothetical protein [Sulfitobacter sediminilitoris]NEK24052.1 hypothetical protein [Sulfitobacter sediminilitoris]